MSIDLEFQLFKGKTFSGLMQDIYENQVNKKKNISAMIEDMRKLITNQQSALAIGPIIKDLIDVSVFNDEHLVKLATIAQRIMLAQGKSKNDDGFLSEEEKKQLLGEIDKVAEQIEDSHSKQVSKLEDIEFELDELKNGLK